MTIKTLTINNHSIQIPWKGNDKYMFLAQYGFAGSALQEIDMIKMIEGRLNRKFKDIVNILELLPNNSTIIDIGAGNSLLDLLIYKILPFKNFKFVLVDEDNSFPSVIKNDYYSSNYQPYNNWNFLKSCLELNQFPIDNFQMTHRDSNWTLDKASFVLSSSAWGYHFPLNIYLDKVFDLLEDGGYLYISPCLNVDQAYFKLTNKVKEIIIDRQLPLDFFTIDKDKKRLTDLLKNKEFDSENIAFVFLGKK